MFDKATLSFGTTKVMSKVALSAGSSQQGNARRASVGWKENKEVWNTAYRKMDTIRNLTKPGSICISTLHCIRVKKKIKSSYCPLCCQAGIDPIHSCSSIWHTFPSQFDNYHPFLFQRCKINVNDHSNNVTKIMNPMHADRKWKWLKVTLLFYVIITAMVQMFLCLRNIHVCHQF